MMVSETCSNLPLPNRAAAPLALPKKAAAPPLLNREDKHLALSNAIGFAVQYAGNASLRSDFSDTSKGITAYLGFAARGCNYLWKQKLIAKLPLAEKYPAVRYAVSPITAFATHGVALACSMLQNENAAWVGWGIGQVSSLASTAAVGQSALPKLKRSLAALPSRPLEALRAIPVHLFNLTCEAGNALSVLGSWDASDWISKDRFFESKGMVGEQFLHAFSNPVLKIAGDAAKSEGSLQEYLEDLSRMEKEFETAVGVSHAPVDLIHAAKAAGLKARPVDIWRGEDLWKAGEAERNLASRANELWLEAWNSWKEGQEHHFLGSIDEAQQETSGLLSSKPEKGFGWLFQTCRDREVNLQQMCRTATGDLSATERNLMGVDFSLFSSGPVDLVQKFRSNTMDACRQNEQQLRDVCGTARSEIHQEWDQKISAVVDEKIKKVGDFPQKQEAAYRDPKTPLSQLPDALKADQDKLNAFCSDPKKHFEKILKNLRQETVPYQATSFIDRIAREVREVEHRAKKAEQTIAESCKQAGEKLQKIWNGVQRDRDCAEGGYWKKFLCWLSTEDGGEQVALPDSAARSEEDWGKIAQKIEKAYAKCFNNCNAAKYAERERVSLFYPAAKEILSAAEPFDETAFTNQGSRYIKKLARPLALHFHPDKWIGSPQTIIAIHAASDILCGK